MIKNVNIDELNTWLNALNLKTKASVKINGAGFSTAYITVDFGSTALETPKLSPEQNTELNDILRATAQRISGKNNIRVQHDNYNGLLYWASL